MPSKETPNQHAEMAEISPIVVVLPVDGEVAGGRSIQGHFPAASHWAITNEWAEEGMQNRCGKAGAYQCSGGVGQAGETPAPALAPAPPVMHGQDASISTC